tara:strand:- start:138 stop:770 length:633 start_codon:yes stop_codon:yes gene_type:complete
MKKFIIRYSPKFKGTQKLKSFKPIEKKFTQEATSLRQEAAEKIARRAESRSLESGMQKIRAISMKLFKDTKFYKTKPGTNFKVKTTQGKSTLRRIDKAKTQAFKTARAKGVRTLQKTSDKLGIGIRRYGSQKAKTFQKLSDAEARELGFPPREVFKSVGKKGPMSKLDRAIDTYSRAEKMNPRTGKFETFRKYDIRPIDPVASFYRKKRK